MAPFTVRSNIHVMSGSEVTVGYFTTHCLRVYQPLYIRMYITLIFASFFHYSLSSQSCSFNRTYDIPSVLDYRQFTESQPQQPVEILFDSDRKEELNQIVNNATEAGAIVSVSLMISIPVSIATEPYDVIVQCSPSGRSNQATDEIDDVRKRLNCVDSCNGTLDVTNFVQSSPSDLDCVIWTNQTSAIFKVSTEVTLAVNLRIVVQGLQRRERCPAGQFQCKDGRCFDVTHLCDGIPNCLHEDDEDICDGYPLGSICNFENGLCGWKGLRSFWLRHSGPTQTRLTGPSVDHTQGTSDGYYVYTEANSMKSNRTYKAVLKSPLFDPMPSSEDESIQCEVTFYYHLFGDGIVSLSLYAIDEDDDESTYIFGQRSQRGDQWYKAVEVIQKVFTKRYYLQFEGQIKPFGKTLMGDIAIDDISMSHSCFNINISNRINNYEECLEPTATTASQPVVTSPIADYSTTAFEEYEASKRIIPTPYTTQEMTRNWTNETKFLFTPCSQIGQTGPSQKQCDLFYLHSNVTVRVRGGLQEWVVPRSGIYRIKALGASGGSGVENPGPSAGASAQAVVNLTAGSKLLILVGQAGHSACSERTFRFPGVQTICNGMLPTSEKQRLGNISAGGGGGGGGGSYVALLRSDKQLDGSVGWDESFFPLVVAGGGGGLSFSPSTDGTSTSHGVFNASYSGMGTSGVHGDPTADNVPGAGGGWYGNNLNNTNGLALIFGGRGGQGCWRAFKEFKWQLPGGFGGGGGGCTAGGGGGGYTGGNASLIDSLAANGNGGSSFVFNLSLSPVEGESGANLGQGEVLIELVIMCPDKTFVPFHSRVNACNIPIIPMWCWVVIVIVLLTLLVLLGLILWCRVGLKRSEEDRLRDELSLLRKNVMSEINPLYGARKSVKEEDFPELPRNSLKLLHPLGNGAFGEVYKGAYFPSREKNESISVAIKTLSKEATDEHKNDFLMEAVLLGSLKHYNIVKLIGVSFIRVPKFLILEFMEGGDLKTFLQANRPTFNNKTTLKMTDLLRIAMDIVDGCKYLESLRFIHRDLAARNILLTSRGVGRVAKIGDFGMAKDVYKSEYYRKSKNSLVPVKWMPPEAYLDGVFSTKTDVWSYGVLLWEILTFSYIPYPGLSNHEVIQCVAKGDRMCPPRYCPKPLKALIESCWRTEPELRPTFEYLCEHLTRLSSSSDVISVTIPTHGIDVDRCLVSAYSYESDPENAETNPMLPQTIYPPATAHFSMDAEGYLQAEFSKNKEGRKTSVRLDSTEDDFPKSVQMNIYDSSAPTSASILQDDVNGDSNELNHEYSFPPAVSVTPKANVERSESLV